MSDLTLDERTCPECGDSVPPGFTIEDDHFNCNYPEDFIGWPDPDIESTSIGAAPVESPTPDDEQDRMVQDWEMGL